MTVLVPSSRPAVTSVFDLAAVPVGDLLDSCSPDALVEALALAADIRAAAAVSMQVHVLDEQG